MNHPKVLFQIDNGNGWRTIAEVNIVDGVAQAPNEWTMARVLRKQVVYTGYTQEVISVPPDPRDTHFVGFADQLVDELLKTEALDMLDAKRFWEVNERQEVMQLIAQRAYDLACHVAMHTQLTAHGDMSKIPDLPELPEVKE